MLKKEAVASCIIDDSIKLSYPDLFILTKNNVDGMIPVLNCIKALNYGLDELKRTRLTNKVIFSTHKILMEYRSSEEIIGLARKKQNKIGGYVVNVSGMKTYNPPEPGELNSCMTDIQKFIERNDSIDILIKAALLHYQMEVVHPFDSGNGKIGRIITLLYLFKAKILTSTILPISEFLETHKVEYFDRIKAVHNLGEYEQWVKFFLKALIVSADASILQIEGALQLRYKNLALIRVNANTTKDEQYLLDAYQCAENHIFLNITSIADAIGISYNTAAKIVNTLTDLGILKLMKEQERNKTYVYHDFLKLMGINYII